MGALEEYKAPEGVAGEVVVRRGLGITGVAAAVCAGLALLCPAPTRAQMPVPVADDTLPVASDARLAGDDKQTRLIIDLTRKIDVRAFTIADPYRVVIDVPQVNFQFPAKTGEHGRGIVKAFRFGVVMKGRSRIVIDVTGPVWVARAFVVDPAEGQPARLVVDLAPVDRETFLRAAAIDNHLPKAPDPPAPHEETPKTPGDTRPMIVLDPGHGGIDNGTHAPSGEQEKDLVLRFASMLREKLEKTGKYRVAMTRSDDTFIPLMDRVRFARARDAQLFISIHCDALVRSEGSADGATIYTLSDRASDSEAQRLADAENRADVIAGVNLAGEPDDIADILFDLAQRETKTFSTAFARQVVTEFKSATRLHKNPLRSAGFRVLKAPDIPSVLIELGYVSNPADLKQLVSDQWRSRTSDAVVQAVHTHFTTRIAGGVRP
jgi:N-acetylmuramoyl-L-alanine amidase